MQIKKNLPLMKRLALVGFLICSMIPKPASALVQDLALTAVGELTVGPACQQLLKAIGYPSTTTMDNRFNAIDDKLDAISSQLCGIETTLDNLYDDGNRETKNEISAEVELAIRYFGEFMHRSTTVESSEQYEPIFEEALLNDTRSGYQIWYDDLLYSQLSPVATILSMLTEYRGNVKNAQDDNWERDFTGNNIIDEFYSFRLASTFLVAGAALTNMNQAALTLMADDYLLNCPDSASRQTDLCKEIEDDYEWFVTSRFIPELENQIDTAYDVIQGVHEAYSRQVVLATQLPNQPDYKDQVLDLEFFADSEEVVDEYIADQVRHFQSEIAVVAQSWASVLSRAKQCPTYLVDPGRECPDELGASRGLAQTDALANADTDLGEQYKPQTYEEFILASNDAAQEYPHDLELKFIGYVGRFSIFTGGWPELDSVDDDGGYWFCTKLTSSTGFYGESTLCSNKNLNWKWSSTGQIDDMKCLQVSDGSVFHRETRRNQQLSKDYSLDDFLCLPKDSKYQLQDGTVDSSASLEAEGYTMFDFDYCGGAGLNEDYFDCFKTIGYRHIENGNYKVTITVADSKDAGTDDVLELTVDNRHADYLNKQINDFERDSVNIFYIDELPGASRFELKNSGSDQVDIRRFKVEQYNEEIEDYEMVFQVGDTVVSLSSDSDDCDQAELCFDEMDTYIFSKDEPLIHLFVDIPTSVKHADTDSPIYLSLNGIDEVRLDNPGVNDFEDGTTQFAIDPSWFGLTASEIETVTLVAGGNDGAYISSIRIEAISFDEQNTGSFETVGSKSVNAWFSNQNSDCSSGVSVCNQITVDLN